MIAMPHRPSGLSKATWTEADLTDMGWHDCRVHAVSVGEYEDDTLPPARLLLDLDYIVRWVEPAQRDSPFTFWITPATLVFEQAWNITGRLGPLHEVMEIADLHRLDPPDGNPDPYGTSRVRTSRCTFAPTGTSSTSGSREPARPLGDPHRWPGLQRHRRPQRTPGILLPAVTTGGRRTRRGNDRVPGDLHRHLPLAAVR
jgi:hypothetical protein